MISQPEAELIAAGAATTLITLPVLAYVAYKFEMWLSIFAPKRILSKVSYHV
jgi:hypothetical protein